MNVIQQYKYYFDYIHYKVLLKKKIHKLIIDTTKLKKEYDNLIKNEEEIKEKNSNRRFLLNHKTNTNENKEVYLISKDLSKINIFDNIRNSIKFIKYEGYILYGTKGNEFNIFGIKNLKNLLMLNKKNEAYNLIDKIGTYKNKPLFIVKYPIPVSLTINDDGTLFYDSESYYNYVDKAVKVRLTDLKDQTSLIELIKKNWFVILAGVLIVLFLSTPEGKNFLSNIGK